MKNNLLKKWGFIFGEDKSNLSSTIGKKNIKKKADLYRSRLSIKLVNGDTITSEASQVMLPSSIGTAWLGFYRWYFTKKTEFIVMRYQDGQTMIRRQDILYFNIHNVLESSKEEKSFGVNKEE